MLHSLAVSNFRSLGPNVEIPLGRLTVLVGPNGSGKSNVLDALDFLGDAMRTGLDAALAKRDGIGAVQRWSATRPYDVSLKVEYVDGEYAGHYGVTLGSRPGGAFVVKEEHAMVRHHYEAGWLTYFTVQNGKVVSSGLDLRSKVETDRLLLPVAPLDGGLTRLYEALRGTAIYSIYPDALRRPAAPDPTRPMRPHGENWTTSLKEVLAGRNAQEFRAGLAELTGDVVDVRVKTLAGYIMAEFKHRADAASGGTQRREKWLSAAQESDGTLRFAGILTALLQDPAPALVGMEEPEITIHTGALRLLFDYLTTTSDQTQVLVSTHSPELLDWVDPEDVRVVERVGGRLRSDRCRRPRRKSYTTG